MLNIVSQVIQNQTTMAGLEALAVRIKNDLERYDDLRSIVAEVRELWLKRKGEIQNGCVG